MSAAALGELACDRGERLGVRRSQVIVVSHDKVLQLGVGVGGGVLLAQGGSSTARDSRRLARKRRERTVPIGTSRVAAADS